MRNDKEGIIKRRKSKFNNQNFKTLSNKLSLQSNYIQ